MQFLIMEPPLVELFGACGARSDIVKKWRHHGASDLRSGSGEAGAQSRRARQGAFQRQRLFTASAVDRRSE